MKRLLVPVFTICILIASCTAEATSVPARLSEPVRVPVTGPTPTLPALAAAPVFQPAATQKPKQFSPITPAPTRTSSRTPVPPTTEADVEAWKSLPVLPESIDPSLQKVYARGLTLGNDSNRFQQTWHGQYRQQLQHAADQLGQLGQVAISNAAEQRRTSA